MLAESGDARRAEHGEDGKGVEQDDRQSWLLGVTPAMRQRTSVASGCVEPAEGREGVANSPQRRNCEGGGW